MINNYQDFQITSEDQSLLLKLSRKTLEKYVLYKLINEQIGKDVSSFLMQRGIGAFVTLYKNSNLRGCIGRFLPQNELYKVIIDLTIASCSQDYRFNPVEDFELDDIKIELSILSPLTKINTIDEFELGKHGLLIRKGTQSGTYLPKVADDTKWTKEEFVGHCSNEKAGIGWDGWKTAELFIYTSFSIKESF